MQSTRLGEAVLFGQKSGFQIWPPNVKEAKRALKARLKREKNEPNDVMSEKASGSQPDDETALAPWLAP